MKTVVKVKFINRITNEIEFEQATSRSPTEPVGYFKVAFPLEHVYWKNVSIGDNFTLTIDKDAINNG